MGNAKPDRPMTREQLLIDVRSICEQVYSSWDGELDVVVLLVPRNKIPMEVASGNTFELVSKYQQALAEAGRDTTLKVRSIKNMGKKLV